MEETWVIEIHDILGLPFTKPLHYFPGLESLHEKPLFGIDWPSAVIRKDMGGGVCFPSPMGQKAILKENAKRILGL